MDETSSKSLSHYKMKLQSICNDSGVNVYDALKSCLHKFITGENRCIPNPVDFLNTFYGDFQNNDDVEREEQAIATDLEPMNVEKSIYEEIMLKSNFEADDILIQDIITVSSIFRRTGEGVESMDYLKLELAMKKISADFPVNSIRFWGKIFGTQKDYYIIECEPEESDAFEESEEQSIKPLCTDDPEEEGDEGPALPKSTWRPIPETQKEEVGEGVNSHVYFVSNHPCGPYERLSNAEPKHIVASRLIHRYFTGDLNSKVVSFPLFPGMESQYLRAQIARISAATQLAPQGFYRLCLDDGDGGDEGGEEEQVQVKCEENEEYVMPPADKMGLEQWVHSRPYILPQGRVTWWNPLEAESEVESDVGANDEDNEMPPLKGLSEEPRPERGPPILTPIVEDLAVFEEAAWTMRRYQGGLCSRISSLLWPGAHTVASEGVFENIYVGWGLKAKGPAGMQISWPTIQGETHEEPVETADPTTEEEESVEEGEEESVVEDEGSRKEDDDE